MKIVKAHQTSWGCPSQWDTWDEEGNYWYLRFRFGHGSASPGVDRPDTYTFSAYSSLDGVIGLEEFCHLAGIDLSDELIQTSVYDYWPYTNVRQPNESDDNPVL